MLSLEGVEGVYLSEEKVNCDAFEDSVRTTMPPSLLPSHSVVMANGSFFHVPTPPRMWCAYAHQVPR